MKIEQLKELKEQIENCKECHFRQKETNRKPWFFNGDNEDMPGYFGTGVFFVSQRPSLGEKHNYSLKRVHRFYRLLKEHGFENAHLTDLVKCKSLTGPCTTEEKNNCIFWLLKEIQILKPRLIVAVGNEVFNELKKHDLSPARLEKILHYSQKYEKADFVETFTYRLKSLRILADNLP